MRKLMITMLAMLAMSYAAVAQNITTEKVEYADSSKYGYVTISLEVPDGEGSVASAIRNTLWQKLQKTLGPQCNYYGEESTPFPAYSGTRDFSKLCSHYGTEAFKLWNARLKAENEENYEYILANDDLTADQKKEYLAEVRQYGYDITLTKIADNNRYVIFSENVYAYTGGAHGAAYGWGAVTFDKKTGKELRNILKPNVTRAMQPLLKSGLKKYFCENDGSKSMTDSELYGNLMIEGKIIPLPSEYSVYPVKDGIDFVYGQYEIACYAAGMPSFTIPYSKIMPYLTDEAKRVLGLGTSPKR